MKPKEVLDPTEAMPLPGPDDAKAGKWKSIGIMALNVLLTVSIVMINKALFTQFDFDFAPTLLLTLHQLTCALGAQLSRPATSRTPTSRAPADVGALVVAIILTRIGGNVLVNLSLKFNSVGMYQLYKMLQVPFVFIGEVLFIEVPFSKSVVLTLAVLLAGVGLATVSDLSFSLTGALCGCIAPILAAANALLLRHIQVKHDITGNELLRQISPWVVLVQMLLIPFTDDIQRLPQWLQTIDTLTFTVVALSCAVAWGLEWSFLVVLQHTSAMSVQVLGHVKTMFILAIGAFVFHSVLSLRCGIGVAIAFGAVMAYTAVKAQEAPAAAMTPTGDPTGKRSVLVWYLAPMAVLGASATFLIFHTSRAGS